MMHKLRPHVSNCAHWHTGSKLNFNTGEVIKNKILKDKNKYILSILNKRFVE